ncbi:MAG TPA: hypothetical protein VMU17_05930, partial [Elusimicrobiota bacterium]|nr:hypothetical protein [Elusimicrobiota bacterium]
ELVWLQPNTLSTHWLLAATISTGSPDNPATGYCNTLVRTSAEGYVAPNIMALITVRTNAAGAPLCSISLGRR